MMKLSSLCKQKKNFIPLATLFTTKQTVAFVLRTRSQQQPQLATSTNIIRAMSSAPFPYNTYDSLPSAPSFKVTSTDITDGGVLPGPQLSKAFGVEGGEDTSPALSWSGFPPETKSFVVSCK